MSNRGLNNVKTRHYQCQNEALLMSERGIINVRARHNYCQNEAYLMSERGISCVRQEASAVLVLIKHETSKSRTDLKLRADHSSA